MHSDVFGCSRKELSKKIERAGKSNNTIQACLGQSKKKPSQVEIDRCRFRRDKVSLDIDFSFMNFNPLFLLFYCSEMRSQMCDLNYPLWLHSYYQSYRKKRKNFGLVSKRK